MKVKDTPQPDMSLKRHRSAPRASANKRKVLMDDTMVLHGEYVIFSDLVTLFVLIAIYFTKLVCSDGWYNNFFSEDKGGI